MRWAIWNRSARSVSPSIQRGRAPNVERPPARGIAGSSAALFPVIRNVSKPDLSQRHGGNWVDGASTWTPAAAGSGRVHGMVRSARRGAGGLGDSAECARAANGVPPLARVYRWRKFFAGLAFLASLGSCDFIESQLAPKARLEPRWETHDAAAVATIDHSAWGEFLNVHVSRGADGIARVDYSRVTKSSQEQLATYISELSATPISRFNRCEQLAYWVNLYNALTVDLVLSRFPIDSILDIDISPGLLEFGPWDKAIAEVEGQPLSLNDIEHRILRPIWRDARIHYALNCAALGCPNLQRKPFTAAKAERMLESAAREFINSKRGVRIEDNRLVVSKIYNWFSSDFGGNHAAVISHLTAYASPALAEALIEFRGIDSFEYDWRLNDAQSR